MIHVHDETWQQVKNRYRREAMAMRSIDEHAHFTRSDFIALLTRNVVSDVRAAWSQGALREELGSILRFRYNQLAGTYRGFNGPSEISAQLRERFYYPGEHGRPHHPPRGGRGYDRLHGLGGRSAVTPDSMTSGAGQTRTEADGTPGSKAKHLKLR